MPEHSTTTTTPRRRLRPGAVVLRRDAETVQVGLDPPARVVLPDVPEVRRLLTALTTTAWPPPQAPRTPRTEAPAVASALARLEGACLLVAVAERGDHSRPGLLDATAAWSGPDAGRRLRARAAQEVLVVGPAERTEGVAKLLGENGVAARRSDRLAHDETEIRTPGLLVLVVTSGEPDRDVVDRLVAAGCVHLLMWSRAGLPRVGPLVVPGMTACLRCVDAHESQTDPRRALLLEQAARGESVPPSDPVLRCLAEARAVRDVLRWAEGEEPATFSAVVTVDAHADQAPVRWTRHLHCGCAWDSDLYAAG